MNDVIIIGNGPAGISAALYTVRTGYKTLIIGNGDGALGKTKEIENYYGFEQPISGQSLVSTGVAQAKRIGAEIIKDEVVGLSFNGKLVVQTENKEYETDAMIIATGTSRIAPKITGLKELEGRGISYCAVCDAFFYRGKDVAVLGDGAYALHEAMELLPTSGSVTILTNGKEPSVAIPPEIKVITTPIEAINGNDILEGVTFKDGNSLSIQGLFVAVGVAGSEALSKKIGIATEGNKILVDETMATNIQGIYAAGDCTGGFLQIAKAVYEGAKAGTEVVKYLRKQKS